MSLRVDGGRPEAARSLRNSFGADPVGLKRTPSDGHRSFVNRSQTGVDHPASDQRKSAITSVSKLIRKLSVRGDLDNSGRCPPPIPTAVVPVPFRSQRANKRPYDGATGRAKVAPEWIMRKCWRGGEYVHPHSSL